MSSRASWPLFWIRGARIAMAVYAPWSGLACSFGPHSVATPGGPEVSAAPEAPCASSATALVPQSVPFQQLSRMDCLLDARRLGEVARMIGDLGDGFSDDAPLMRAVSERLMRLLRTPGRLSPLPYRVRLAESSLPVPSVEAQVAGRSGLLIWDSGAEATILNESLCSELGLRRIARTAVLNASGEVVSGPYTAILNEALVLGNATLDLPAVVCVDLQNVAEIEPRILGVLGGNALGSSSYQLSRARSELALGASLPADLRLLEAEFEDGLIHVRAEANGKSLQFLLDTGADFSVLSERVAEELNLSTRSEGGARTTYQFGGRVEEPGDRVAARLFVTGDERREGVEFRVGEENLLGLDFIGDRTLVVDRERGVVGLSSVR